MKLFAVQLDDSSPVIDFDISWCPSPWNCFPTLLNLLLLQLIGLPMPWPICCNQFPPKIEKWENIAGKFVTMVTCHSWQANQFISGIQIFVLHETYIHSLENANQCDVKLLDKIGRNKSLELKRVLLSTAWGGRKPSWQIKYPSWKDL